MTGSTTKETNPQETVSDRKPTNNAPGNRKCAEHFVEFNDRKTVTRKVQLYEEKLQETYVPGNVKNRKQETGISRKVKDRKGSGGSTPAKGNMSRRTMTPGKSPTGKVCKLKLAPGKTKLSKAKVGNSDIILSLLPLRSS